MSAHMVHTVEELRALDDGTAFQDSAGDAGVWKSGEVHYPETSPMGAAWCIEQFAPLAVLAPAVDPDDEALVEKVARALHDGRCGCGARPWADDFEAARLALKAVTQ